MWMAHMIIHQCQILDYRWLNSDYCEWSFSKLTVARGIELVNPTTVAITLPAMLHRVYWRWLCQFFLLFSQTARVEEFRVAHHRPQDHWRAKCEQRGTRKVGLQRSNHQSVPSLSSHGRRDIITVLHLLVSYFTPPPPPRQQKRFMLGFVLTESYSL